jgi:hypothetical protein
MKYNVINEDDFGYEFNVVTEDGGVACIRYMDEEDRKATTDYYQDRITDEKTWQDVWDNLGQGKMYYNDWKHGQADKGDLILEALNWLVVGETNWEKDPTLFTHLE